MILFGLTLKHELIVNASTNKIVSINFDIRNKNRTDKKVHGKRKSMKS